MTLRGLAAALLLGAACGGQAAIELVVDGDLEPGAEVDEVRAAVRRGGAETWSGRFAVQPGADLPLTYRIERASEGDGAVELVVGAYLGGRRQVEARREASFVSGETLPVRVCLWRRCRDGEGPGCAEGSCEEAPADGDGDGDADVELDADAEPDAEPDAEEEPLCSDSCPFRSDGVCEDGGADATMALCDFGTDCADCGPRLPGDCVPQCHVRRCGPDGCGGTCEPGCGPDDDCAFGGACVRWVEVHPDGPFLMGSPEDEWGSHTNEEQREVTLTRGFAIPSKEVDQAWFTALIGYNVSSFADCGLDCPVDSVSWPAAAAFCNLLSAGEGLPHCYECTGETAATFGCELRLGLASPYHCAGYRLPTEAEFEYAARAGTTTATYNGDLDERHLECEAPNPTLDPIAWFCGNAPGGTPQPRGLLAPNALGLHDMLGNLFEFTHDWYERWDSSPVVDPWGPAEGTERTARGGSYVSKAFENRAAVRIRFAPTLRGLNVGFRCVRSLD